MKKYLISSVLFLAIIISGCSSRAVNKDGEDSNYKVPTGSSDEKVATTTLAKEDVASEASMTKNIHEDIDSSVADFFILNFNNDSDKDGLTNLQEFGYGTDYNKVDTDEDGYADNDEIKGGYDPNGPGRLISDDCAENSQSDKCYLENAIFEKNDSLCRKISDREYVFDCLLAINLINKNQKICEDLEAAPENDEEFFYNTCLAELKDFVDPKNAYDRDDRVINDVKQIQTALELYYNDNGVYPPSLETLTVGDDKIMHIIPVAPKGETIVCNNYDYQYTYLDSDKYSLTYCIDGVTDFAKNMGINPGINAASPYGIK